MIKARPAAAMRSPVGFTLCACVVELVEPGIHWHIAEKRHQENAGQVDQRRKHQGDPRGTLENRETVKRKECGKNGNRENACNKLGLNHVAVDLLHSRHPSGRLQLEQG